MILLTGATGFIGSSLLDALIEIFGKDQIVSFTSNPTNKCQFLLHNNYKFDNEIFVDSELSEIDTIIHAGAFTPKSSINSNNIDQCNSNILNTARLINAHLPRLKKFIFLSTLDVYGYDNPITEESPVNPGSLYGHSKLYCEKMIYNWAFQNSIIYQILRIGHVYGPGEEKYQKLIPTVMNRIINNESVKLVGTGDDIRTFIYISDVVESIIKSFYLETSNEIINVVGEEQVSVKNLVNKIIELSNKNVLIERIETEAKSRNLVFDNSKLKKLLHEPTVTLSKGLEREWQYLNKI